MKINSRYLHFLVVTIITVIIACGCCITSFAANTDPNLTYVNQSDLRSSFDAASITPTTEKTLTATTATSGWVTTTFDTCAAAKSVDWTSSNTDIAEGIDEDHDGRTDVTAVPAPGGGYYSQASFKIKSNNGASGSCTIVAERGSGYVNFTIVVENSYYSDLAHNVSVDVFDATGDYPDFIATTILSTVALPGSSDPLYPYSDRAMSFSTPAYALANMKKSSGSYDPDTGYIDYITNFTLYSWGVYFDSISTDILDPNTQTTTPETVTTDYYLTGWNYRVLRNGILVEDSKVIAPADFKLQDGDAVYWVYGTQADVDDIFG